MVAPFAPVLLKPVSYQYTGVTFTLQWQYSHPTKIAQSHVRIRRKLSPSGSYQYLSALSGGTWGASVVDIALTAQTATVVSNMGTVNNRYQYSVAVRHASAAEWSPFSEEKLVYVVGDPTVTIATINANTTSPDILFTYTHPQSIQLARFRVAMIDRNGVANEFTATAADNTTNQKAFAFGGPWDNYITRTDWIDKPDEYQYNFLIDLTLGQIYDFVVETQSDGGQIASDVERVTVSLTIPTQPTLVVTPDDANNVMEVHVEGGFNLMTPAYISDFEVIPKGEEFLPLSLYWGIDSTVGIIDRRKYTDQGIVGVQGTYGGRYQTKNRPYSVLEAAYATYTIAQASAATYAAAEKVPISAAVGQHKMNLTPGYRIPVDETLDYTFGILYTGPGTATVQLQCYNAAGSSTGLVSGSILTTDPVGIGNWKNLRVQFLGSVIPALTTMVTPVVTFPTASFTSTDLYYMFDVIGFARSTATIWGSAGYTSSYKCIIERLTEVNGEVIVTPVPGYSRAAPGDIHNFTAGSVDERDRMVPIGFDGELQYRAYLVAYNVTNEAQYSQPAVVSLTNPMQGSGWWLRDVHYPDWDVFLDQIDFSSNGGPTADVLLPLGRDDAVVVTPDEPFSEAFDLHFYTRTQDEYDAMDRLIRSGATLYVQSNVRGQGWYVRVIGQVQRTIIKTPSSSDNVTWKPMYEWNVGVTSIGAPSLQAKVNYNYVDGITYLDVDL